jgi:hypothetical protein
MHIGGRLRMRSRGSNDDGSGGGGDGCPRLRDGGRIPQTEIEGSEVYMNVEFSIRVSRGKEEGL